MTRSAALTVLLPGARIAPASSTCTWGHTRLEKSGTKGLSRCSIVVGRVRIITSLWRTGDDRTLPLLPYRMDKVELLETVWKVRMGSISWSREPAQRGEIAHLSALRATERRPIRPVRVLSRQSLLARL